MTDFVRKMEDFIKQEKQVMKQFKDPDNIKAHKNYIARTISVMKNDALHQLIPLLEDKQRTLIRQYRGHNDELNRDIKELERDIKEIKSFTFRDEAIKMSKNSKLKSYLAQEFRDIKAILKKKSFKDASSSEYDGMDLSEMKQLRSELMRKQERERAGSDKFHEYQKQISELTRYINRFKDANPPRFEESKHKRDKDGKFSSTGGGGTSAKESGTSGRKSVSEMSKSKNKAEQKKVAKAYWVHFLSGVDDLVDFAGENEELAYYAEEGDIDSMASMLGSSKGGVETALEAIEEYDTDELKQLEKILNNDSAIRDASIESVTREAKQMFKKGSRYNSVLDYLVDKYSSDFNAQEIGKAVDKAIDQMEDSAIKDARIELRMGGRTIGYIEADTLSEAVRRYEEEHPEARGKVNAYMADRRFKDSSLDDFLSDLYDNGVHSKRELVRYLVEHKDVDEARARQMVNKFAQELRNAELPIRDAKIVTKEEWESAKKQGYTSIINGKKYMLMADPKSGTVLAPVEVRDEVSQMVQRLIKNRMDF